MRYARRITATTVLAIGLAGLLALGVSPSGWAQNDSTETLCAEVDNVNVPLFSDEPVSSFTVRATHPQYWIEPSDFPCPPRWEDCDTLIGAASSQPERWTKLWDDGQNVLEVSYVPDWWRGRERTMAVHVNGQMTRGHYLRLYRKIPDANSWPQVFVLYADGNARLKPQPPTHMPDTCFGSSVLIGPASPGARPFADVAEVVYAPSTSTFYVTFADGQTAILTLSTSRAETSINVRVGYTTDSSHPFAIFRSMFVCTGRSDVDAIQWEGGEEPILSSWRALVGSSWFFHRNTRSDHNTCAPDLAVTLEEETARSCERGIALSLPSNAQILLRTTIDGLASMVDARTGFPLE